MELKWGRELSSDTHKVVLGGHKHPLGPLLRQTVLRCFSSFPMLCLPLIRPSFRVPPTVSKGKTAILGSFPCTE